MNDLLVSYDLAVKLKEINYKEFLDIYAIYYTLNGKDWKLCTSYEFDEVDFEYNIGSNQVIVVPLYSQVFKWFRNEHKIDSFIRVSKNNTYCWKINKLYHSDIKGYSDYANSYKEAQEMCLEKLIEIVNDEEIS